MSSEDNNIPPNPGEIEFNPRETAEPKSKGKKSRVADNSSPSSITSVDPVIEGKPIQEPSKTNVVIENPDSSDSKSENPNTLSSGEAQQSLPKAPTQNNIDTIASKVVINPNEDDSASSSILPSPDFPLLFPAQVNYPHPTLSNSTKAKVKGAVTKAVQIVSFGYFGSSDDSKVECQLCERAFKLLQAMEAHKGFLVSVKGLMGQWQELGRQLQSAAHKDDNRPVVDQYLNFCQKNGHQDDILFHFCVYSIFREGRGRAAESVAHTSKLEEWIFDQLEMSFISDQISKLFKNISLHAQNIWEIIYHNSTKLMTQYDTNMVPAKFKALFSVVILGSITELNPPNSARGQSCSAYLKKLINSSNKPPVQETLEYVLKHSNDIKFLISEHPKHEWKTDFCESLFGVVFGPDKYYYSHTLEQTKQFVEVLDIPPEFGASRVVRYTCAQSGDLEKWILYVKEYTLSESFIQKRRDECLELWQKIVKVCIEKNLLPEIFEQLAPDTKSPARSILSNALIIYIKSNLVQFKAQQWLAIPDWESQTKEFIDLAETWILRGTTYPNSDHFKVIEKYLSRIQLASKKTILNYYKTKALEVIISCPKFSEIEDHWNLELTSSTKFVTIDNSRSYQIDSDIQTICGQEFRLLSDNKGKLSALFLMWSLSFADDYFKRIHKNSYQLDPLQHLGNWIDNKPKLIPGSVTVFLLCQVLSTFASLDDPFSLLHFKRTDAFLKDAIKTAEDTEKVFLKYTTEEDQHNERSTLNLMMPYFNQIRDQVHRLNELFDNLAKKIETKDLTNSQILSLTTNLTKLRDASFLPKECLNSIPSLKDCFFEYGRKIALQTQMIKWLDDRSVSHGIKIFTFEPATTLRQMIDTFDETETAAQHQLGRESVETLMSFLDPPSAIFRRVVTQFEKESPNLEAGKPMTAQEVSNVVAKVYDFLNRMLGQELTMQELRGFEGARFGDSWDNEVKRVTEFFSRAGNQAPEKLESLKTIMKNIGDIQVYAHELDSVEEALRALNLPPNEIQLLSNINKALSGRLDAIKLKELPTTLAEIKSLLGDINPNKLKYFGAVYKALELVRFCKSQGFDDRLVVVRGNVQGFKFDMDLVNKLVDVKGILQPVLHVKKYKKIKDLCQAISNHPQLAYRLEEQIAKIGEVHDNLATLRDWFSPSSEMRSIIPTIKRAQYFQVEYSESFNTLNLVSFNENDKKEDIQSAAKIETRLRGMKVFVDENGIGDDETKTALSDFDKCFEIAKQIHQVFILLKQVGHPAFVNTSTFDIGKGSRRIHVKSYDALLKRLRMYLDDWNQELDEQIECFNRLAFLTPKQTSQLILRIKDLIATRPLLKNVNEQTHLIYCNLLPYVTLCCPEYCEIHSAGDSPAPFSPKLVINCFDSAVEMMSYRMYQKMMNVEANSEEESEEDEGEDLNEPIMPPQQINMDQDLYLDEEDEESDLEDNIDSENTSLFHTIAGKFLELVNDSIAADFPEPEPKCEIPSVILAYPEDSWKSFRIHVGLCEKVPHPNQLLWADELTTQSQVLEFLRRMKLFNHLVYIIHGVNRLAPSIRDNLSKWASSVALSENEEKYATLYLVFTSESGVDMFNFLPKLPTEAPNEADIKSNYKPEITLNRRKISELHCMRGFDGKSTVIRHQMNQYNSIRIDYSVTEHFTPGDLIKALRQSIDPRLTSNDSLCEVKDSDIALHLNVSAYASLQPLARFLEHFLYWGLLVDPHDGFVMHLMDTNTIIRHHAHNQQNPQVPIKLPPHLRWKIFVELSAPPAADKGFEHLCGSVENVLIHLPSILHLSSTVKHNGRQLELDEDYRIVASFEAEARRGPFEPAEIMNRNPLNDQQTRDILESMLEEHGITEWRYKKMFLTILADNCKFLAKYRSSAIREWATTMQVRNPGSAWERDLLESTRKLYNGGLDTYRLIVAEAKYLASMGRDTNASNQMPLLSAREKDYTLNGNIQWNLKFLAFSPANQELITRTPESIFFCHDLESGDWAVLRRDLAAALNISQTERMIRLVEQQNYILTEKFASKLLILHQRHRTGNNVILVGDTGQGKTEMLNLYSLMVNANSDIIPDILGELSELVNLFFKKQGIKMPDELARYIGDNAKSSWIIDAVKFILDIKGDAPAEDADDRGDDDGKEIPPKYLNSLSTLIVQYVFQLLSCPLLQPGTIMHHIKTRVSKSQNAAATVQDVCNAYLTSSYHLENLVSEILNVKFQTIFHRILMHQQISASALVSDIGKVVENCKKYPNIQMILFIDEFNTTSCMGLLKEIIVDKTINSQPLPNNLFVVAAMNPTVTQQIYGRSYDYSGGSSAAVVSNQAFAVRPPHESMNKLMFHFPSLGGQDERSFWHAMLERPDLGLVNSKAKSISEGEILMKYVLHAHEYIRKARIKNMHPSIRDLIRISQLFKYFRTSAFGSVLLGELSLDNALLADDEESLQLHQQAFSVHFWKALMISLAMGYVFRLESGNSPNSYEYNRKALIRELDSMLQKEAHFPAQLSISSVVDNALKFMFDNTDIPAGIARTNAVMENLFCIVVCVDLRMPLTICGPPGCSKTLAYTIAADNMKGPQSSPKRLYRLIGQMHRFRYQCSEKSSDAEVEAVFDNAIALQHTLQGACSSARQAGNCCVLLDEAGLPNELEQPLKSLHHVQDHPQVSSVVLTNKWLDAAKTNRTLQLLQSDPSEADLKELAGGCIFGDKWANIKQKDRHLTYSSNGASSSSSLSAYSQPPTYVSATPKNQRINQLEEAYISGLHDGYMKIREDQVFGNIFQLRDFVYFLRYIRRSCVNSDSKLEFTSAHLFKALLRNFNGLSQSEFGRLAKLFYSSMRSRIERVDTFKAEEFEDVPLVKPEDSVEALRDSLNERLGPGENINTSAYRYICLLDPTDSQTSIDLLFSLRLLERDDTLVIRGSDFEEDASDSGHSNLILEMKNAMGLGKTVILLSASQIFGSFYDVFNKHFTILTSNSKKNDDFDLSQSSMLASSSNLSQSTSMMASSSFVHQSTVDIESYEYYANVAVGALSSPCKVHPNFKLIVHLPRSELNNTPAPFLNRFEKYELSIRHSLELRKSELKLVKIDGVTAADVLMSECSRFISELEGDLQGSNVFFGFTQSTCRETLASLVLSSMKNSVKDALRPLEPIHVDFDDENMTNIIKTQNVPTMNPYGAEWTKYLIRQTNYKILQLARPEAMFEAKILDGEYMTEYLLRQEHLSVARFLKHLFKSYFDSQNGIGQACCSRWCIFTRSSGELARLHNDPNLKKIIESLYTSVQASFKNPDMDQEQAQNNKKISLQIHSLSDFVSMSKCLKEIENFASSKHDVLLITADMSRCSDNQVNILRNSIDEQFKGTSKLALVLLHLPPELASNNRKTYPAIFSDYWDFIYIDSLGISSEDDNVNANSVPVQKMDQSSLFMSSSIMSYSQDPPYAVKPRLGFENIQDESENAIRNHVVDVDARKWLAHGYGIRNININVESIENSFKSTLLEEARLVVAKIRILVPPKAELRQALQYSRNVYFNRPDGSKIIMELLEKENSLCNVLLSKFSRMWCNGEANTSSILSSVVKTACSNIRSGKVSGSLASSIRNSLRYLMTSVLRLTLTSLLNNFNLEPILRISHAKKMEAQNQLQNDNSDEELEMHSQFISLASNLIEPPAAHELFESTRNIGLFKNQAHTNHIRILSDIPVVPSLPMYDIIAKTLFALFNNAKQQSSATNRTPMDVWAHVRASASKNNDLKRVFILMQKEKSLLDQFCEDFVRRTLKLPQLKAPWISLMIRVSQKLADVYGDESVPVPLKLFMVKFYHEDVIIQSIVSLIPLQELEPAPSLSGLEEIEDLSSMASSLRSQNYSESNLYSSSNYIIDQSQFSRTKATNSQIILKYFFNVLIKILWRRFVSNCLRSVKGASNADFDLSINTNDDSEKEINNILSFKSWCKSFRSLLSRISSNQQICDPLDPDTKSCYFVMLSAFYFMKHFEMDAEQSINHFAVRLANELQNIMPSQNNYQMASSSNIYNYHTIDGIEGVIGLIEKLTQPIVGTNVNSNMATTSSDIGHSVVGSPLLFDNDDIERRTTHLVEDLVRSLLSVNRTFSDNMEQEMPADISLQLNYLFYQYALPGKPNLITKLKPQWLLSTLLGWLSDKPPSWLVSIGNIIEDVSNSLDHQYVPYVPKLSEFNSAQFDNLADLSAPFEVPNNPVSPLEILLYDIYSHKYMNMTSKYDPLSLIAGSSTFYSVQDKVPVISDLIEEYSREKLRLTNYARSHSFSAARTECLAYGVAVILRIAQTCTTIDTGTIREEFLKVAIYQDSIRALLSPIDYNSAVYNASPQDGFCYLLQNIKNNVFLLSLLSNDDCVNFLGLNAFKLSKTQMTRPRYIFRFLQDPRKQDHLSKLTHTLENCLFRPCNANSSLDFQNTIESILSKSENREEDIYNIRFVLTLISYFKFFVEKRSRCQMIYDLLTRGSKLQSLLRLSDSEMSALKFVSGGPLKLSADQTKLGNRTSISSMFSEESLENQISIIPHIMVNVLAVALGTPQGSNHIREFVFEPKLGNGKLGPGSAYSRQNKDCGFIVDQIDALQPDAANPILGNIQRHRLLLNTSYWFSLVWSILVDPINGSNQCRQVGFINAIGEELFGNTSINVSSPQVSNEHLMFYLFVRGQRPFELLNLLGELKNMNILDSAHYFNETLLEIQQACIKANRDSRWKGIYSSIPQVVQYEEILQQQFFKVEQTFTSRNEFFTADLTAHDPRLEMIFDWQTKSAKKLNQTGIEIFAETIKNRRDYLEAKKSDYKWEDEEEEEGEEGDYIENENQNNLQINTQNNTQNNLQNRNNTQNIFKNDYRLNQSEIDELNYINFIQNFWDRKNELSGAGCIPRLISFLQIATEKLSYRLTLEDTLSFTFPDALRYLDQYEPKQVIADLQVLWEEFKSDWAALRDLVPQFPGCPDVVNQRAFELTIPVIDNSTIVASLLHHQNIIDQHDYIRRMLSTMADRQNDILDCRSRLISSLDDQQSDDPKKWKKLELICDYDHQKTEMPISWLNNDINAEFLLITGDRPLIINQKGKREKLYDNQMSLLESFVLSTMDAGEQNLRNKIKFDWKRIAEFIVLQYTSGRNLLQKVMQNFKVPFQYASNRFGKQNDAVQENQEQNSRLFGNHGVDELKDMISNLRIIECATDTMKNNWKAELNCSQQQFMEIVRYLNGVAAQVLNYQELDPNGEWQQKTLIQVEPSCPSIFKKIASKCEVSCLSPISSLVIESLRTFKYIWYTQEYRNYSQEFDSTILDHLNGIQYRIKLEEDKKKEKTRQEIENFVEELLTNTAKKLAQLGKYQPFNRLADVEFIKNYMDTRLSGLTGTRQISPHIAALLTPAIQVKHFVTFFRYLKMILEELSSALQINRQLERNYNMTKFSENVPNGFESSAEPQEEYQQQEEQKQHQKSDFASSSSSSSFSHFDNLIHPLPLDKTIEASKKEYLSKGLTASTYLSPSTYDHLQASQRSDLSASITQVAKPQIKWLPKFKKFKDDLDNPEKFKIRIEDGAYKVQLVVDEEKNTFLHIALKNGYYEFFEALVINITQPDEDDEDPEMQDALKEAAKMKNSNGETIINLVANIISTTPSVDLKRKWTKAFTALLTFCNEQDILKKLH